MLRQNDFYVRKNFCLKNILLLENIGFIGRKLGKFMQ